MANQSQRTIRKAHGYKVKRGYPVNSSAERKASGRSPWHPAKRQSGDN